MVRRVILLACAGILVFSMSACGKSQEAAKHQIEGSHVVSAESSVSAQEPEELSEAEQINKHAMSPNATSVRSLHAAFKQYILKNGDKESP